MWVNYLISNVMWDGTSLVGKIIQHPVPSWFNKTDLGAEYCYLMGRYNDYFVGYSYVRDSSDNTKYIYTVHIWVNGEKLHEFTFADAGTYGRYADFTLIKDCLYYRSNKDIIKYNIVTGTNSTITTLTYANNYTDSMCLTNVQNKYLVIWDLLDTDIIGSGEPQSHKIMVYDIDNTYLHTICNDTVTKRNNIYIYHYCFATMDNIYTGYGTYPSSFESATNYTVTLYRTNKATKETTRVINISSTTNYTQTDLVCQSPYQCAIENESIMEYHKDGYIYTFDFVNNTFTKSINPVSKCTMYLNNEGQYYGVKDYTFYLLSVDGVTVDYSKVYGTPQGMLYVLHDNISLGTLQMTDIVVDYDLAKIYVSGGSNIVCYDVILDICEETTNKDYDYVLTDSNADSESIRPFVFADYSNIDYSDTISPVEYEEINTMAEDILGGVE